MVNKFPVFKWQYYSHCWEWLNFQIIQKNYKPAFGHGLLTMLIDKACYTLVNYTKYLWKSPSKLLRKKKGLFFFFSHCNLLSRYISSFFHMLHDGIHRTQKRYFPILPKKKHLAYHFIFHRKTDKKNYGIVRYLAMHSLVLYFTVRTTLFYSN